jgi:ribosomal protein L11 methyltransferase
MTTLPSQTIVTLETSRDELEPRADELQARWEIPVIQLERPEHASGWLEVYFADAGEAEIFLAAMRNESWVHAAAIRRENPRDWQTFWRHHFHTTLVGHHLRIVPVWERDTVPEDQRRQTLWLDPGLSFGTGDHFTTRFCLERIDDLVPRGGINSMLDVGTGSAILAMAASRLGVRDILALDHDAIALEQARENLRLNGLDGKIRLAVSDILADAPKGSFDLVCANVYTTVLIAIAAPLAACTASWLVLSGIRDHELDEVAAAYQPLGFEEAFRDGNGEWGGLAFKRRTNKP